jgi:hypothetical protein
VRCDSPDLPDDGAAWGDQQQQQQQGPRGSVTALPGTGDSVSVAVSASLTASDAQWRLGSAAAAAASGKRVISEARRAQLLRQVRHTAIITCLACFTNRVDAGPCYCTGVSQRQHAVQGTCRRLSRKISGHCLIWRVACICLLPGATQGGRQASSCQRAARACLRRRCSSRA